jgi:RNA polymerase sigma-70 factor, ECF subfamily
LHQLERQAAVRAPPRVAEFCLSNHDEPVSRGDPLANTGPLIRRVYAYVAYRIGDGPDAEDVTSETFERAIRYRDGFDPRKGEPISWLIGIARRCIADAALRNERPVATVPESVVAGHEEQSLRNLEMRAAVARLDPRDRELIALRFGADLTAKRIGEVLGLRTNTVEVSLHRALARLRAEFVQADAENASPAPWISSTRSAP